MFNYNQVEYSETILCSLVTVESILFAGNNGVTVRGFRYFMQPLPTK